MKKIFASQLTVLLLLLVVTAFGQDGSGLLRVQGKAERSVSPNETSIYLMIEAKGMDYKSTLEKLGRNGDDLVKTLKKLGYAEEKFNTIDLNVYVNSLYINGQRIDSGFVGRQNLKLVLPYEKKSIIDILNKVGESSANPTISFSFGISGDTEKSIREELMKAAVYDAKSKAEILANAGDCTISGISEISYGAIANVPVQYARTAVFEKMEDPGFGGFNVANIDIVETVDITFSITDNK